jgi:hypothetical protein
MGPPNAFSWDNFESDEEQLARLGRWFDHISSMHPNETILLVSHGGPSASLFRHSQRDKPVPPQGWKVCKFCGLYALARAEEKGAAGSWKVLLEADDEHLAEVPTAAVDGHSSALEQAS